MLTVVFAAGLAISPWSLVRVDDPNYPGADAYSATGAVLLEPPPAGTHWRWEIVPEVDRWQADEALQPTHADRWQQAGVTGAGVKVAVFDILWFGAEADPDELGEVSTHDCYRSQSCELPIDTSKPRFSFEEGVHGFACAEVIRDIAPDVELYLVRTNGFTGFENAVRWAVRNDIDIISQSLTYFNNSHYDGRSPFGPLVEELAANDVLLVSSAGNYAREHWRSHWTDGDLDGRLDGDGDNGLWVYLREGPNTIYVNWNQFGTCGETDLDARVLDGEGTIIGRGEDRQDAEADACHPVERMNARAEADGWHRLEVSLVRGSTALLDVDIYARDAQLADPMPRGSIADPGVEPRVFTVAAVDGQGYLTNNVEGFSSWGPTNGGLSKPDIAGPDGLSTSAYGARGFFGTSASTPAVAGLIALVMSDDPSLSSRQAADKLQGWALGDAPVFSRQDPRWGVGKARLPLREPLPSICGRRPLLMPLLLLPLGWWRRRRSAARRTGTVERAQIG